VTDEEREAIYRAILGMADRTVFEDEGEDEDDDNLD
jgi:hypothetical protein